MRSWFQASAAAAACPVVRGHGGELCNTATARVMHHSPFLFEEAQEQSS